MILATHAEPEYIASCNFPTKNDIMDIYHFSKDDGYDVDTNDEFDQYHYFLNGKLRK